MILKLSSITLYLLIFELIFCGALDVWGYTHVWLCFAGFSPRDILRTMWEGGLVTMFERALTIVRPRLKMLAVILSVCLVVLLWLSPSERVLGGAVKLVYLHGALVRVAATWLAVSLPINLMVLVDQRRPWALWGEAIIEAVIIIWLLHTIFSMVTTYMTWGVFIAWFEPRTRFTFSLAGALLAVFGITRLVADERFTHFAFALLAGVSLWLLPHLGTVQHPLNPIGASPSIAIRLFYVGIWIVAVALSGLLVVWLATYPGD